MASVIYAPDPTSVQSTNAKKGRLNTSPEIRFQATISNLRSAANFDSLGGSNSICVESFKSVLSEVFKDV